MKTLVLMTLVMRHKLQDSEVRQGPPQSFGLWRATMPSLMQYSFPDRVNLACTSKMFAAPPRKPTCSCWFYEVHPSLLKDQIFMTKLTLY